MSSTRVRTFNTRQLHLHGKVPPPTIPLIVGSNFKYISEKNQLEEIQEELKSSDHEPLLQLLSGALDLLRTIEKPVAVVAVCGPHRTGKSYLLSRMLGVSDAFQLGHTTSACTHGIWMATQVLECDEFALLLLDTEGIDSVSGTGSTDAKILVMSILLSSYFIYNSIHVPTKSDLEKMSCFTQISKSIIVRQGEQSDLTNFRDHFPSFTWLLRDATLKTVSEAGEELSPTDYLKTQILRRSKELIPTQSDIVAMAILSYFPSVECHVLPPPSADATVLQNILQNEDKLSIDFNTCMQNFVQHVYQKVSTKKGFTTSPVDGSTLAVLADMYIHSVNDPKNIITLEGSWDKAVSLKLKELQGKLVGEYKNEMKDFLNEKMPVKLYPEGKDDKSETLFTVHHQIFRSKLKIFEDKVNSFMSHGVMGDLVFTNSKKEKVLRDFKCQIVEYDGKVEPPPGTVVGGILREFIEANERKSSEYCTKLINELLDSAVDKRTHTTSHGTSSKPLDLLMDIREEYYAKARGPATNDVYVEKCSALQLSSKQMSLHYDALQSALDRESVAQLHVNEANLILHKLQCELKRSKDELNEYAADCDRNIEQFRSREEERLQVERMKREDLMQSAMTEALQQSQEKYQDQQKASEKHLQGIRQLQEERRKQQALYVDKLQKELERARKDATKLEEISKKQKQDLAKTKEDAKKSTGKRDLAKTKEDAKKSTGKRDLAKTKEDAKKSTGKRDVRSDGSSSPCTRKYYNHRL